MSATILVVDDEENARMNYVSFLEGCGYEMLSAATLNEARQYIQRGQADIILLDVFLPDGYGPVLLDETARLPLRPPVIVITAQGEIDMAVEAMKNGAHDFFQKPIRLAQLEKSIQRAVEIVAMRRELNHLRQARVQEAGKVIARSNAMSQVLQRASRAAAASASVLITGETGTGKDVIANAIHQMGTRQNKPFVAINCAAIQSTMLESELFGHEAGAFTGADKRKLGLMEVADGGILFLDEISSMPVDMQAKLLRALEDNSFRRVGGANLVHVDVQVLAASNRPLAKLIAEGQFRDDLYYRLKVVDLHLPPLREHPEDIPDLVGLFMRLNNQKMGINIQDITPRALQALTSYHWPGNVRELRHMIGSAMLFCNEAVLDLGDLPDYVKCSDSDRPE